MTKSNNKIAEKTTITIYDRDRAILKKENEDLQKINGTNFNLSAFTRACLRDENIMNQYKNTDNYLNQK